MSRYIVQRVTVTTVEEVQTVEADSPGEADYIARHPGNEDKWSGQQVTNKDVYYPCTFEISRG